MKTASNLTAKQAKEISFANPNEQLLAILNDIKGAALCGAFSIDCYAAISESNLKELHARGFNVRPKFTEYGGQQVHYFSIQWILA